MNYDQKQYLTRESVYIYLITGVFNGFGNRFSPIHELLQYLKQITVIIRPQLEGCGVSA